MNLVRPSYIDADLAAAPITHSWDDSNVRSAYRPGDPNLIARLEPLSTRAQLALTVAVAEWIVTRLSGADPDPVPAQYLQAAWAGTVHQAFCPYIEFNDNEWRGPVRGPLHVVMALYNDALHFEDADQEENAAWICQLAELVLPSTDSFHAWLDAVISRLEEWFPAPDEDEFDFAYDWQAEEPFCPRECFDPAFTFDPADAPGLITAFLATIEDHNNPFMRAPSQLQDAGIEGVPYPER